MPLRLIARADSPFWWISGSIGGRRIRESTGINRRGSKEKELAQQKCSARELALIRDDIHGVPKPRHSFASIALSYIEHAGPHSDDTLAKVDRLLEHFGSAKAADDIDQVAIDEACTKLLRPGAKPATRLRQVISPVRAVLTHGAKRRMCAIPLFDIGKTAESRTEWMTPADVDALIAAATPHLRPLIAFLAGTGARLSEALKLEWKDVDLHHGRATLRGVITDEAGEEKRGTKSGKDRIVDLCPRVIAALLFDPRARKRSPGVIRAKLGKVFLTRAGRPYAERKVQGGGHIKTGWRTACKLAGITRDVTPHTLRHSWASWRYACLPDLLALRHEGGWSSVTLVERYAHLTPKGMAAEIDAWRACGTLLAPTSAATREKATAG